MTTPDRVVRDGSVTSLCPEGGSLTSFSGFGVSVEGALTPASPLSGCAEDGVEACSLLDTGTSGLIAGSSGAAGFTAVSFGTGAADCGDVADCATGSTFGASVVGGLAGATAKNSAVVVALAA